VLPSQLSERGIVRNAQLSQLSLVRGSRLSDSALQPLHLSCVLLRQMGEAVLCRTPAALHTPRGMAIMDKSLRREIWS